MAEGNSVMETKREPIRAYWNWEIVLYKGDLFVDQGTIREVADRRGVKKETIYGWTMPHTLRKVEQLGEKSRAMWAIRI